MFAVVQEVSNVFYDHARFVQFLVARMRQGQTNYHFQLGIRVMLFSNVSNSFQLQILQVINLLANRRLIAPIWQVRTLGDAILYLSIGSHSRLKFFGGRPGKDFGWWDEGRGMSVFLLDMWREEEYSVCFLLFISAACWIRVRVTAWISLAVRARVCLWALFPEVDFKSPTTPWNMWQSSTQQTVGPLIAVNITIFEGLN